MGAAHLALDADETAALLAARDLTGDRGGAGALPGRWTGVAATLVDAANGWPAAVDMAVRLVAQGAEHHTVASQLAAGTGSIRALIATVLDLSLIHI